MSHHVLLVGGHGRVSQLLTPLLLQRSWTVTSLIRSKHQAHTIEKLAHNHPGKLNIHIASLDTIKNDADAKAIIDQVKPDYVVFSAGAGGGGVDETFHIDRDSAIYFMHAAAATPSITRFLLVSWLSARRRQPPWWNDEEWQASEDAYKELGEYSDAKLAADEELHAVAAKRGEGFAGIDLRPGWLTNGHAGRVELGKTKTQQGKVSRATVAHVAAQMLEAEGVKSGWYDLLDGEDETKKAVEKVVAENVDAYY